MSVSLRETTGIAPHFMPRSSITLGTRRYFYSSNPAKSEDIHFSPQARFRSTRQYFQVFVLRPQEDSNLQPSAPQADALSIEL